MAAGARPGDRGQTEPDVMEMAVTAIERGECTDEGFEPVTLATTRGNVETRYYPAEGATAGAVFVGGAGGGFDTPVRGWLYPRLSRELSAEENVACLRVRYRAPNDLAECTLDVLAGIRFLESEGVQRVAVTGHSFGGAVVIQAAAHSPLVYTCVALSTQTYGTEPARQLGPRCSLLLAHGMSDEILPHRCSEQVYRAAREPKELLLEPDVTHGLDGWSEELPRILRNWIVRELNRGDR